VGGTVSFIVRSDQTHIHVAAASATGTVDINYWGH
jgi:hypothetical protein